MTNEQRIKQIEAELASLKVDLAMEPPTLERQEHDHINDALNYQQGKKDWVILEFKDKDGEKYAHEGRDLYVNSYGLFRKALPELLTDSNYFIYSVRRLSDNTTWTVGDKVLSGTYHVPQSIIRFFTFSDKLIVETNVFILDICRLRQLAKPLFTTADGVQIFQGDKFWYWHDDGWLKEIDTGFHEWWSWKDRPYSTREAADEAYNTWAWNEPVLSCEEAVRLLNTSLTGDQLTRLKLFVKDKIAKR